jgi:hypothetical protein
MRGCIGADKYVGTTRGAVMIGTVEVALGALGGAFRDWRSIYDNQDE